MATKLAEKLAKEKKKATRRKKAVLKLTKVAKKNKKAEKKALHSFAKVSDIRKAYENAKKVADHFKRENKMQRVALLRAAQQEKAAATATAAAATHATLLEKQAIVERNTYRGLIAKATAKIKEAQVGKIKAGKDAKLFLKKAKLQLLNEHKLRLKAETESKKYQKAVKLANAAAKKEHKVMLTIKAAATKLAEDRKKLARQEQAASQMISVEHEAALAAKKMKVEADAAAAKKLQAVAEKYEAKLKAERAASVTARAKALGVSARAAQQESEIAKEKALLRSQQKKANTERLSWKRAIAAFKKEQKARNVAKGAFDASTKAMTKQANLQIKKAQAAAKRKDDLNKKLKAKLKSLAARFRRDKLQLEAHAKQAEANAAAATKAAHQKMVQLTQQQHENHSGPGVMELQENVQGTNSEDDFDEDRKEGEFDLFKYN
jgi:hypothetical protein